jgi:ABC-type lipoprotein release transport system permease subunit
VIGSVTLRYALRGLLRHKRRTLLSMLGAGVGCALSLVGVSWISGGRELQIRAAAESGAGHIRAVNAEWAATRENTLRLKRGEEVLAAVRALPGVKSFAPRSQTTGLLAFGNRTAGVLIWGVDPVAEEACNRVVKRGKLSGRYLLAGDRDKCVIGRALARRLGVELDDDLYLTLAGRKEIASAMLRVVGIIDTGSRDLDLSVCHVTLDDVSRLTGYPGIAEVAIVLDDHRAIPERQAQLAAALPPGNAVVTWKEVHPGLAANVEGDTAFTRIIMFIVVVVVSLGILSAQLTAVLERRREMAVLSALGMSGSRLVALILLEAVFVGLGAAAVALLLGAPFAYLLSVRGVDIAAMTGGELAFENVLFDPVVYGEFGPWIVWQALGVSLAATVCASIYPAWFATRTDPAEALRVV